MQSDVIGYVLSNMMEKTNWWLTCVRLRLFLSCPHPWILLLDLIGSRCTWLLMVGRIRQMSDQEWTDRDSDSLVARPIHPNFKYSERLFTHSIADCGYKSWESFNFYWYWPMMEWHLLFLSTESSLVHRTCSIPNDRLQRLGWQSLEDYKPALSPYLATWH